MNAKNRRGPRTVPWCTPESTSASDDFVPSRRTDCFLWWRNDSIQHRVELRTHNSPVYAKGVDEGPYQTPLRNPGG